MAVMNAWASDEIFNLVQIVRANDSIYNTENKNYFNRPYIENLWSEIDLELHKSPGSSLAKWTNQRISFNREYKNYQKTNLKPTWLYFDQMMFLGPFLRKKPISIAGIDAHIKDAFEKLSGLSRKNNFLKSHVNDHPSSSGDERNSHPAHDEVDQCTQDSWSESIIIKDDDCYFENDDDNYNFDEIDPDDPPTPTDSPTNEQTISEKQSHEQSTAFNLSKHKKYSNNSISSDVQTIDLIEDSLPESQEPTKPTSTTNENCYILIENQANTTVTDPNLSIIKNENEVDKSLSTPPRKIQRRNDNMEGERKVSNATTEGCFCRTDPDSMFLMSLLPDMRTLSGKDKYKFKIAIQNILQNLLFPD